MPEPKPDQTINLTTGNNAQFKGVAIGNDNQMITDATAETIVQAGSGAVVNIAYGMSAAQFASLAGELAVTQSALKSFFKILQQQQTPPEDLDRKLREIATHYKELVHRLQYIQSEDPQVIALKEQAKQAIEAAHYQQAEVFLNQAEEDDLVAIRELQADIQHRQKALEQRQYSAAETNADNARLQRVQLRYAKAAQYSRQAARLLPEDARQQRADYLNAAGYDFHRIACYAEALPLFEQSLAIQREIGDTAGEGTTLNNLSQIFQARGEYATALTYLEQSLAIQREIGDKAGMCATLFNMGHIHFQNEELQEALEAWGTVYRLAKPSNLAQALEALDNLAGQIGLSGGLEGWETLSNQFQEKTDL